MEQRNEPTESMESRPLAGEASVAEIRHAVRDSLDDSNLDPGSAYDCLVAVTEACTNAVIHARRNEPFTLPRISWRIDASEVYFSIEDFSERGWSMSDQISVESETSPLAGRVGGFGLHLMADLMDEVNVRIGPAGTTVTMSKHF